MNEPFIVAEVGANHGGSFNQIERLVRAAKNAGADAVKFQTYTAFEIAADTLIESGPWGGRSYRDLYIEGSMPWHWHRQAFEMVRRLGMIPFSSPFSVDGVKRLETIYCPIYKIASPEIRHHELIAAAARTHKPLIISTGMAELSEIYEAAEIAEKNGCKDITFLHCISAYPADPADFNLATMVRLMHHNFKVGLSDHSLDNTAAIAAVALGASVIEKHLCMSRADGGLDCKFSLEPAEFADMVKACRSAHKAIGEVQFGCRPSEADSYQYRRSLWVVRSIKAGQKFTREHLSVLRPNYGLDPGQWDMIVGKTALVDVPSYTPMSLEFVE